MINAIWKYELRPWTVWADLPAGAEVLSAGAQGESVVVWVRADIDAPKVKRTLFAIGTGHEVPTGLGDLTFVDTVQMNDGLVWHVFDAGEVDS